MNTPRSFLMLVLIAVSGIALSQLQSVESPPSPRLTTTSPVEQYRIIDPATIPVHNAKDATTALENTLNDLGSQGWRVRTGSGTLIILAR
jgi:hypothetical protein